MTSVGTYTFSYTKISYIFLYTLFVEFFLGDVDGLDELSGIQR